MIVLETEKRNPTSNNPTVNGPTVKEVNRPQKSSKVYY